MANSFKAPQDALHAITDLFRRDRYAPFFPTNNRCFFSVAPWCRTGTAPIRAVRTAHPVSGRSTLT